MLPTDYRRAMQVELHWGDKSFKRLGKQVCSSTKAKGNLFKGDRAAINKKTVYYQFGEQMRSTTDNGQYGQLAENYHYYSKTTN